MSHIAVKSLSVYYGDYCALKDIDFHAEEGEFVAIVGRSGSGKSTFLHALAGFVPSRGKIKMPKAIGMVLQHYAVFSWFTVAQNIAFGLENYSEHKRAEIVNAHLKLAGLEDKRNRFPAELSGGQVQRVALARSLAHNPEVLLMDEPYGALDAYTRDKMQQWLLDVWMMQRKTILFVTHNIEEAIFLADRILVLSGNRFVKEFEVPFVRPRLEDVKFSPEFNLLRKDIFNSINAPEM